MAPRPAKITRPRASGAIPRSRLFAKLDRVLKGGAVWVSGQPGAGKTTLVASWLAERKLRSAWLRLDAGDADLATFFHYVAASARVAFGGRARLPALSPGVDLEVFARRFFRTLLERLPRRAVLVLDDVSEVPDGAPLHLALRALVEELPHGAAVVLVSRGDPPPALARMGAQRQLATIPARELELTAAESWALARRQGFAGSRARAEALHHAAHGWAAGLVLLLARARGGEERAVESRATFDFFAGEVFERADPETRRVLLEAALLDMPTASLVARATGDSAAPRVLAALARRGVFTLRHDGEDPAFEFHALFRAFLLRRGREELPPRRANEVRRAAAEALAERGGAHAEAAFALFIDVGALVDAVALVVREAPALLAAGRAALLDAWIARLPSAIQESDPWLLHFAGVARMVRDPEGARARLERAHAAFVDRGDAAGVWLSWAAAVETTLVLWTDLSPLARCLDELEALRARFPIPSPEVGARVMLVEMAALVHHAPGHPALRESSVAARALALQPGDDGARLMAGGYFHIYSGWWRGDLEAVRPVVKALRTRARAPGVDSVAAVYWLVVEAMFHEVAGDPRTAVRVAEEARALAVRTGVHAWDAILLTQTMWGAIARGDLPAARKAVSALAGRLRPGNPMDLSVLRLMESLVAARSGAFRDAASLAAEAKALGERTRCATVHVLADVVLARALSQCGTGVEADAALAAAREKIRALCAPPFEHLLALVEADRALGAGQLDAAAEALARAVPSEAAAAAHVNYLFSPDDLARLWSVALRHGVAREAVRCIVRRRALVAPPDAPQEWPWPVRIRALGRFEVERDGVPLATAPRGPRKPLEVLRVLVALGGRDVSEDAVADALWPDSEADAAHHALETTLYRLRRMIGQDAVVQRGRKLSIATDRCWVDALALEERLGAALAALDRRADAPAVPDEAERIVALYRGPLLADAGDAQWAVAPRERLRRKLARWLDARSAPARDGGDPGGLRSALAAADPALRAPPALRLA